MRSRVRVLTDYVLAVGVPLLATLLRQPFAGPLGDTVPYLLYFPAIVLVGWCGGFGPGVLATLASLGCVHIWIMGGAAWQFDDPATKAHTLLFMVSGFIISGLCGALHRGRSVQAAEKDRYRVTLASIGDGVITTDTDGKIDWMNAEAERLTGCEAIEARGRRWDEVFRLHNEDTRVPFDDPVSSALQGTGGRSRGVPAVLMAVDGREIPVEETAAPIKGRGGVTGVVIVLRDVTKARAARRRMEEHTRELEQRVRERTQHLEHALRDMESFAYSVSHDLRSPLRTIQGYAAILLEDGGAITPEERARFVRRIQAGIERLDHLTTDLLAYARVSSGELPLAPMSLAKAITDCATRLGLHEQLHVNVPAEARVEANEIALQQVLSNLLDNARRFVAPGVVPVVRVEARRACRDWRVVVSDNGIGIDREYHGKIFEMFERLEPAKYPGTGVGLPLVKRALERMRGRIGVESELGKGSRFWFELPSAADGGSGAEAQKRNSHT